MIRPSAITRTLIVVMIAGSIAASHVIFASAAPIQTAAPEIKLILRDRL